MEVLDLILGQQAAERRERSTERRIREARFAERKTLEGFDWKFNQKAINRVQIEELATGDFIRRHANLLLVGQSGVGKSQKSVSGYYFTILGHKIGVRLLFHHFWALLNDSIMVWNLVK